LKKSRVLLRRANRAPAFFLSIAPAPMLVKRILKHKNIFEKNADFRYAH